MRLDQKPRINAAGFTLIEVLIAVFVLAIGILGIAGLQIFAKQNSYDAIQRTTASHLATSIAERIRMNPQAAGDYVSSTEPVAATTTAPSTCNSNASPCTPEELAVHDLQEWHSAIIGVSEQFNTNPAGGLVSPSACITAGTEDNEYTIAIAWRGRSALSNPAANDCGVDATEGGTNVYGTDNEYRRLFVMNMSIE